MNLNRKNIGMITGILLFLVTLIFTDLDPENPLVTRTLAVVLLMAAWWITEAIPLAVTALVPLVLFPLLGIVPGREIATSYMNQIIFVYMGGFMVALAMERWNLHRRIALKIMMWVGAGPGRILFGFMISTAFLSMWISNTAATLMMLPILMSIVSQLEDKVSGEVIGKYATGVLLAIAYSSSIGGITTLVGSPTNLVFPQQMAALFPDLEVISFTEWIGIAAPISITMFIILFLYIYFLFVRKSNFAGIDDQLFRKEYSKLGKASYEERVVLIMFASLAALWTLRSGIQFDNFRIPGWGNLFEDSTFVNDAVPAMFISILLFLIPASKKKGTRIMNWKTAQKLPWDIVLLFGGGFALASGFKISGLAVWMGEQLAWTGNAGPYIMLAAILTLMIFLTELTSNVASIQMLLPVFAAMAVSSGTAPVFIMFPATLASSMAFMLPTATPPNAIVYGSQRIEIRTMVRTGFALNIISIFVILLFIWIQSGKLGG